MLWSQQIFGSNWCLKYTFWATHPVETLIRRSRLLMLRSPSRAIWTSLAKFSLTGLTSLTAWLKGQQSHLSSYRLHSKTFCGRAPVIANCLTFSSWFNRILDIANFDKLSSWFSILCWHAINEMDGEVFYLKFWMSMFRNDLRLGKKYVFTDSKVWEYRLTYSYIDRVFSMNGKGVLPHVLVSHWS